jgi:excisionase family DNA binding protein
MPAGVPDAQTEPEAAKYLSLEQVAAELQVRPNTVRMWLDDPAVGLRGYQLGGKLIRIRRDELDAWIEQQAIEKTGGIRERLREYRDKSQAEDDGEDG